VFPLAVRSQAIALAAVMNYASNFGVSLALPTVQEAVGLPATYLGFAGVGVVALLSIYLTGGGGGPAGGSVTAWHQARRDGEGVGVV
jgi:hypothetical protein